jgi:tape measure domain-containing protein
MATTVARLQAVIEANTKDFEKKMDTANKAVEKLGDDGSKHIKKFEKNAGESLARVSKGLGMLGAGLTLGVSLPLIGLGKAAFQSAVKMESLEAMLRTVMGSAEATAKELKALEKSAKLPGLDFSQAVKGSANLQSMGFSAEKARFMLENFANAIAKAGGGREEFERVVVNLTQIGSSAKLTGDELREMAQAVGPEFRQAMQRAFDTVDPQKLAKMGISGKQAIEMIAVELSKTARANADTMKNQLDNFEQEMEMFKANIGKALLPIAKDILPKLADGIKDIADWFKRLGPSTQSLVINMGLLAVAMGPVSGVLGGMVGILSISGRFLSWLGKLTLATNAATAAQVALNGAMAGGAAKGAAGTMAAGAGALGFAGLAAGIVGGPAVMAMDMEVRKAGMGTASAQSKTMGAKTQLYVQIQKAIDEDLRKGLPTLTASIKKLKDIPEYFEIVTMRLFELGKFFDDKTGKIRDIKHAPAETVPPVNLSGVIGKGGVKGFGASVAPSFGGDLSIGQDIGNLLEVITPAQAALTQYTEGLKHLATEAAKLQDPRTRVAEYFQMELRDFKLLSEEIQKSAIGRFTKDKIVPGIQAAFGAILGITGQINQAFVDMKAEQDAWAQAGLDAFEKWYYALKKASDEAAAAASKIGDALGGDMGFAVDDIAGKLTDMQMLVQDVAGAFVDSFYYAIRDLNKGFGSFFDNVVQGFESMLLDISAQIIRAQLAQLIGNLLGTSIGARAAGGPVGGGKPYVVGERGPELFVPNGSGHIVPNHQMGGGVTINMTVQTTDAGSFRRSQQQIIEDAMRQASVAQRRG